VAAAQAPALPLQAAPEAELPDPALQESAPKSPGRNA